MLPFNVLSTYVYMTRRDSFFVFFQSALPRITDNGCCDCQLAIEPPECNMREYILPCGVTARTAGEVQLLLFQNGVDVDSLPELTPPLFSRCLYCTFPYISVPYLKMQPLPLWPKTYMICAKPDLIGCSLCSTPDGKTYQVPFIVRGSK